MNWRLAIGVKQSLEFSVKPFSLTRQSTFIYQAATSGAAILSNPLCYSSRLLKKASCSLYCPAPEVRSVIGAVFR